MRLQAAIGFEGGISDGLLLLPDGETLVYALGSTVVMRHKDSMISQKFMRGHTDKISCLAVSKSGRYLASGQVTHMGFVADIIVWDLTHLTLLHRLELHKAKVQALDFSCDEKYLISVGGEDDNSLVLWDVEKGFAVCGSPMDGSVVRTVKFLRCCNSTVIVAGNTHLSVWDYDPPNNKLRCTHVQLGQLRRHFNALYVDADDAFVYCATSSGDVLQVDIEKRILRRSGPKKTSIAGGATSIVACRDGRLLVGAGDGCVRYLQVPSSNGTTSSAKPIREVASCYLNSKSQGSAITTLLIETETDDRIDLLAGTATGDVYRICIQKEDNNFSKTLLQTSHAGEVNAVAFPDDYGALFATCGVAGLRIWHVESCRELLRIIVPNIECHCVRFKHDDSAVVTGWGDGSIHVFRPQSGSLIFKRSGAHPRAIRTLDIAMNDRLLLTGDDDGMVRVWDLLEFRCDLIASMKEHKSAVTAIRINPGDPSEFVSCSEDGSCVIWDLQNFHRRNSFCASTCFKAIEYLPDGSQLITAGTDRKITYWDPFDAEAIRTIDGSETAPIRALAMDRSGESFVSGSEDMLVRSWSYDEGCCYNKGQGHSGSINSLAISPDGSSVVSAGAEGGIFIWNYAKPTPLTDHES